MLIFALAFAVYTLFIVGVGLLTARKNSGSDEDYFLAGRSLGPWMAALSASASSESGWVTLGLVGSAFDKGYLMYWIIPGTLLGFAFNWFVLAGPMRDRSAALGAVTLPEFFGRHFGERLPILRTMSVVVILVAMWLYVAAQFAAAGTSFATAFELKYVFGVLIGTAIVLFYTVLGGFRAACWTDFVQGLIMLAVLAIMPIWLLVDGGGYAGLSERIGGVDDGALLRLWPDFGAEESFVVILGFLFGSGALGVNFGFVGAPHILVRFMALRDRREARVAGLVSIVWGLFIFWGAVTIGILVRGMAEAGETWATPLLADESQTALIVGAKELLPGVLSGLALAAVLSAICSTADSQLVVAASAVTRDLRPNGNGDDGSRGSSVERAEALRRRARWNRLAVLGLGLAAMALVINQKVTIYEFVLEYGWAILGASFGPQLILLLLWRRATYAGCIAGMATGFVTAIAWKVYWPGIKERYEIEADAYNLTVAFALALVVNVIVSLLTTGRGVDVPPGDGAASSAGGLR